MAGESGPTEVNIGPCECPGTPHVDGDIVWLSPKPDLEMGLAVREALRQSGSLRGDADAAVRSALIRYGVKAWNVRDESGPLRITTDRVAQRLGWGEGAIRVSDAVKELYWDTVLDPLGVTRSTSAPSTPDEPSTSPNPESGQPIPSSSPQ